MSKPTDTSLCVYEPSMDYWPPLMMTQDPNVLMNAQLQGYLRLTAVWIIVIGVSDFEDAISKN